MEITITRSNVRFRVPEEFRKERMRIYESEFNKLDPETTLILMSTPGTLAYVDNGESLNSVCQTIVSALGMNKSLQRLSVHTLFGDLLRQGFIQCQDYVKIKHKIEVIQSSNFAWTYQ